MPVVPIIGTRKLAQLKDNLASVEVNLGGDHLARLDRVSRIEMGYPRSFFEKDLVRVFSTGGMVQLIDRPGSISR